MARFVTAESGHVVNVISPKDITGGATGQAFSMANYNHATLKVFIGTAAAAFTALLVNQCTDASGTGATAIPFNVYKMETPNGDVLGARTAVTAAGMAPANASNIFYVIELDAAELDAGTGQYVQVQMTNGVNSVLAHVEATLSGSRFAGPKSATVIT